jgi:hypothetical protein
MYITLGFICLFDRHSHLYLLSNSVHFTPKVLMPENSYGLQKYDYNFYVTTGISFLQDLGNASMSC